MAGRLLVGLILRIVEPEPRRRLPVAASISARPRSASTTTVATPITTITTITTTIITTTSTTTHGINLYHLIVGPELTKPSQELWH